MIFEKCFIIVFICILQYVWLAGGQPIMLFLRVFSSLFCEGWPEKALIYFGDQVERKMRENPLVLQPPGPSTESILLRPRVKTKIFVFVFLRIFCKKSFLFS
jgi:hypothetical protein